MKKITSILLSLVLTFFSLQIVFANTNDMSNFKQIKTYSENQFTDVSSGDWFAENVKKAYELGLVSGTSETTFNPNADITIAETITLASRLNNTYKGNTHTFVPADVWYQTYVDYAIQNGIIKSGEYGDFNAKATRAQFVEIFASSLPNEALKEINTIEDRAIPDISTKDSYATSVYKLYRAGILTGNDDKGTFAPNTNIQRSAVAAIVSRMAIESMRVSKTLEVEKLQLMPIEVNYGGGYTEYISIDEKIYDVNFINIGNDTNNELYAPLEDCDFISPHYNIKNNSNNPFVEGTISFENIDVYYGSNPIYATISLKMKESKITFNNRTFAGISAKEYGEYNLKSGDTGRWNGVRFYTTSFGDWISIVYNVNDLAEYFDINKSFYIEENNDIRYIAIK